MNYRKIVIDGYNEEKTQRTPYVSYFKREAQVNKRDNFVEFSDFFNGCQNAVGYYGRDIQHQYEAAIEENDTGIRLAKYRKLTNVQTKEEVKESVKRWEEQKQRVIDSGLGMYYVCKISATGEIVDDNFAPYKLYCSDIIELMKGIIQAKQKLIDDGKTKRNDKLFSGYIIHENKCEVMKKLHGLLDNNVSGMEVARVLEALEDEGYIPKNSRIITYAIKEFKLKCTNQSISKYFRRGMFKKEEKQGII